MKKIYLLAVFCLTLYSTIGFAQPIINIPDALFKTALVSDNAINTNLDTEIDSAEAASYTGGIFMAEVPVTSLVGIEAFTALTSLYIGSGALTTVDLSSNTTLTDLNFEDNLITNLILPTTNTLVDVNLRYNQLSSLNVSNTPNITTLNIANNQISAIDLNSSASLINFLCDSNQLTSLDFYYNPNLQQLSCRYNNLTTLKLTFNYVLSSLFCTDNPISCVDVSTNSNLSVIEVIDCPNLTKLNLKNGMNIFLTPSVSSCPLLQCVQVDDSTYSATTWGSFGGVSYFMNDCGQPSASFTHNAPVCSGSPVVFDQTTANIDWFKWDYGDGTINTSIVDPTHLYTEANYYYVSLTAGNCYGIAAPYADINLGTSISGAIDHSSTWLANGDVVLLKYEPFYTSFEVVNIQNGFETAGDYDFQHVFEGQYIVKVIPDTIMNPELIPTYSGDQATWEAASIITHPCFTPSTMNISMLELPASFFGAGSLSGEIIEGLGFERAQGDPIHGVDVKLGITAANIVAATTTDTLGQYSFNNVPFGTYTIYVDIAGLLKDSSYTLTIDSTSLHWTYLDYLVDSTSIYILGNLAVDGMEKTEANTFSVYPNPIQNNAIIQYNVVENADVKFDLYNMFGVKLHTLYNNYTTLGEHLLQFNPTTWGLRAGVYFITCTINGKQFTQRVVVLE